MPYIPKFTPNPGMVGQTPSIGGGNALAGAVSDATGKLAGAVSDFATTLAEKRNKAASEGFLLEKESQRLTEVDDYVQKLKMETTGDHQGFTDKIQAFIDEKSKEDQKAAPTETARRAYVDQIGGMYRRYLLDASHYENTQRALYYRSQTDNAEQSFGNYLSKRPRMEDDAAAKIQSLASAVNEQRGVNFTSQEADEKILKGSQGLAESYYNGIYASNDLGQYQRGLMELESERKGTVADHLTPEKRASLINAFHDALKTKKQSNLAELNQRHSDNIVHLMTNGGREQDQALYSELASMEQTGVVQKGTVARWKNEANMAALAGEKIAQAVAAPRSKQPEILKHWDADAKARVKQWTAKDPALKELAAGQPGFGDSERQQFGNRLATRVAEIRQFQEKDAAGFIATSTTLKKDAELATLDNPSQVRSFVAKSLAEQKRLEIPAHLQRVLTNEQAKNYARVLTTQNNPKQANGFLTQLQVAYGDHYDDALNEMISHGDLDPLWRIPSQTQNPVVREGFIGSITSRKATKAEWDNQFGKAEEDAVMAEVNGALQPYRMALNNPARKGQNLEEVSRWAAGIKEHAKTIMLTNPEMKPKDAVAEAMRGLRSEKPVLEAADSVVIFRGEPGVHPEIIKSFMESHLRKFHLLNPATYGDQTQALKELGIGIPKLPPDMDEKRFLDHVIKTGTWVSNPAQDGIRLQYLNPRTGEMDYVGDTHGKPLEFKFRDIARGTGNVSKEAYDRTLKQATPFLQKDRAPVDPKTLQYGPEL